VGGLPADFVGREPDSPPAFLRGLTGGLKLVAVPPVYVADLYVQNTSTLREVNVQVTVRNRMSESVKRIC